MSDTKPPHITLDNFWPYQAVVLADQISRYTLSVVRAEADLNLSQWRVLAAIAEKPGRTAANVTAITPMDKTIVSRAVSSLIEAGLVIKAVDSGDKRRSSLSATASGQSIYANIAAKLNEAMISSLSGTISPEDFTEMLKVFSRKMVDIAPYLKP
ncbi:MAG: MarR family winged helix-turn-helix transcriptional regulator [Hellea sp.]